MAKTTHPLDGPGAGAIASEHVLDDAPLSAFHKRLALYSSGGPFLDGYILSIIGVALVQISPQLGLGGTAEGLVGASALIGIFLGAFVGGWLTDRFGRQLLFTVDLIAIIVCSVVCGRHYPAARTPSQSARRIFCSRARRAVHAVAAKASTVTW